MQLLKKILKKKIINEVITGRYTARNDDRKKSCSKEAFRERGKLNSEC